MKNKKIFLYFKVYTKYILSIYFDGMDMLLNDHFSEKLRQDVIQRRLKVQELEDVSNDLDAVINFKVNSLVKNEFEKICKKSHSNVSRELKLFMFQVIKQGKI